MELTSRKKASGQRPSFEASTRLLSPDQIIWSQVAQRGGMSRNKAGGCFTRLSVGPLCLLFRSCRAATADRAHAATGGRALPTSCDFFLSLFFFARPPPAPKKFADVSIFPCMCFPPPRVPNLCLARRLSEFFGGGEHRGPGIRFRAQEGWARGDHWALCASGTV